MAEFKMSLSEVSALFKIKYEKLSENVYNSANVLLGRVKKSYNFTGKRLSIAIPQSFAGGVGSGNLPTANTAVYGDAQITAKKMYAVVEIDRETIKASLSDEGAFVRATKEVVQKGVESFMRNLSRAMFNDGSGRLGQVSNASGSLTEIVLATGLGPVGNEVADATKVKIADFKEANFEERDLIQVVNGSASATASLRSSDKLEIEQVLVDSVHIILKGTSLNIQALDDLVMQESLNNDPTGMKGVLDKTPGAGVTNYGIKVGRRWQAVQKTHSQDISTDVLNEVMLKIKKACGKSPNLIVC